MQHFLINADSKIIDTPRPDLPADGVTGEASATEIFERARVTAAADPTLQSIWDGLFDDS